MARWGIAAWWRYGGVLAASLLPAAPAATAATPVRAPLAASPRGDLAPGVTRLAAQVVAVEPANAGRHIRSRVTLRSSRGRVLRMVVPSGRRGSLELVSTAWPRLRPGLRLEVDLARRDGRWTLLRGRAVGAGAAWTKLGCCTFPASRLPIAFSTDPGLPDWALGPVLSGVQWWTSDPGSHVEQRWLGAGDGPQASIDVCGQGSYVSFADLRGTVGPDVRGLATYCADAFGAVELHVLLDAYVDYPLAQVAAHEWGHGIGLDHTDDAGAVMYAYVNGATALGGDDLAGLRALYPSAYALDVGVVTTGRLTFGSRVDVDVPVRVVGGGPCAPGAMRVRTGGAPEMMRATGARVLADGTVQLDADAQDPRLCRARFALELTGPVGGSAVVALDPVGAGGTGGRVEVPLNVAPEPALSVWPDPPRAGEPLTLYSTSWDIDGDPLEVTWDLDGDGSFDDAAGLSAEVVLPAGEHAIALRVSDGAADAQLARTLAVPPAVPAPAPATPSPAPVAAAPGFGPPVTPGRPGTTPSSVKAGRCEDRRVLVRSRRASERRLRARLRRARSTSARSGLRRRLRTAVARRRAAERSRARCIAVSSVSASPGRHEHGG
jgi:hypothetical protein